MTELERSKLVSSGNRLLVEGPDDLYAIVNLLIKHGVNYDAPSLGEPYVHPCGGWTQVLETLPAAIKIYDRLGVVLDKDLHNENRWISVRNLIRKQNILVPDDLPPDGLLVNGIRPNSTIGVWLMPDNQSEGMLENFLDRLIPQDALWEYACEVVRKAASKSAPFKQEIKARVHTWLAWQEPPGQPVGVAMTARCFQARAPEALRFVDWFKRVFPESWKS